MCRGRTTRTQPTALVFALHPLSISYQTMPSQVGFDDMEKAYTFIGVAPSGLLDGPTPYWFAAPVPDNYDVTFISQLLDHLESTLCIDTTRGLLDGHLERRADVVAARLPAGGTHSGDRAGRRRRVPGAVRRQAGADPGVPRHCDPILPYEGGGLNATNIANIDYWKGKAPAGLPAPLGIDASMALWAKHNGCNATPTEIRVAPTCASGRGPRCKAATVLYIVEGGGHGWPGKPVPAFEKAFGHTTTSIDATALEFKFFFDPASR